MAKYKTLKPKKKGQRPIRFKEGGLHQSLGVPRGAPIPAGAMTKALEGKRGALAKKQANFAKNVLTGGKKKSRKRK